MSVCVKITGRVLVLFFVGDNRVRKLRFFSSLGSEQNASLISPKTPQKSKSCENLSFFILQKLLYLPHKGICKNKIHSQMYCFYYC